MDDEEMYDGEEGSEDGEEEELEEDEVMDESMDDVDGDEDSEPASAFPALEPSLKSVVGFAGPTQGLFCITLGGNCVGSSVHRLPPIVYCGRRARSTAAPSSDS